MSTPASDAPAEGNKCHTCGGSIGNDTQYVRVGNFKFHKGCFECTQEDCRKSLQKEKFRMKDNKFFCAECYVNKFCHDCRHCGEKITAGSCIPAFGYYYHPDHFVCATCSKPFDQGKYYEVDRKPYCEAHFLDLTADKCGNCNKPVKEEDMVKVQGATYHSTCLYCFHCHVPVAQLQHKGSIFAKNSKMYCREDYLNLFCKRCTACSEHILKHCITVNAEYYHPHCLKCAVCDKELDKYICVGGRLRCAQHTDHVLPPHVCSECKTEISNEEVVLAVGKQLHERCFQCGFCGTQLEKAKCKLKEGRLSCESCLTQKGEKKGESRHGRAKSEMPSRTEPWEASTRPKAHSAAAPAPPPKSEKRRESGKRINTKIKYKRGERIGQGTFGKVYEGMNSETGELIAIKQVRIKSEEEKEQAAMLEMEIQLMEDLRHPNIVNMLGTERIGDKINILMEFVPGKSLDVLLDKFGGFSEPHTRKYTKQLLSALAFCHASNVVHRDIKGKNILVDTHGNLKLADFGSAKRFNNVAAAPSVGYTYTPLWTAPEVLNGDYTSKIDVWSTGCVIIEMLTGQPPWAEHNFENPFRALYHIGHSDSIPKIPDNISDIGKDFILKCLSRDPDVRPSAEELLLHEWVRHPNDSDSDD